MSHVPNLDPDTCAYLRNLAARIYSEKGRGDNTMQPTALLHEAWMKVANSSSKYESREHFLASPRVRCAKSWSTAPAPA